MRIDNKVSSWYYRLLMKVKIIISAIFLVVFGRLLLSQLGIASVNAQATNPVTGPITYPITYYIRGEVLYKILGWYRPAVGATVKAENIKSHRESRATVGRNGQYAIAIEEPGSYKVRAFDSRGTIFLPLRRFVEIIDHDVTGVNFVGTPRF